MGQRGGHPGPRGKGIASSDQRDTDADAIGNACNGAFNGDCNVNFVDLAGKKSEFLHSGKLEEDMNGDGTVNFSDLGLTKASYSRATGPARPAERLRAVGLPASRAPR